MVSGAATQGPDVTRWLARVALVLIAAAVLAGLYLIPLGRSNVTHVWPVHSHHLLVVYSMALAWVAVSLAAIIASGFTIRWLCRKAWP